MTFPSLRPPRSRRSGSALIIVLGILSILLVMSVTFSALVRTERGGTTNLKNSQIAREALQSALVQAMEAIEQSFDDPDNNPSNNWPVPCWPYPWIASAQEPGDGVVAFDSGAFSGLYYQSGHVGDGASDAHVLSSGMSDYLTPAQVALVRSAKCGWSPLRGSANATADGVIGRCAYVALDTTGYLDANIVHRFQEKRAATLGEDPYAFNLPSNSDNINDYFEKEKLPCSLKNPGSFKSARDGAKAFLSFAEMRHYCSSSVLNLDPPTDKEDFFPADLFSFSSLSLEEPNPNGAPKVVLPADQFEKDEEIIPFGADALRSMVEVFARSRKNAGMGPAAVENDTYTFFSRLPDKSKVNISRARLATVALLDAMDEDTMPGRNKKTPGNYWDALPDLPNSGRMSVTVDGKEVADLKSGATGNPLNFPATDSIPLLDRAYAYMHVNKATAVIPDSSPEAAGESYIEYEGEIRVGGLAQLLNRSEDGEEKNYSLTIEFEVLAGNPGRSASEPDSTDNKKVLKYLKDSAQFLQREWKFGDIDASKFSGTTLTPLKTVTKTKGEICDRWGQEAKHYYISVPVQGKNDSIPFSVKSYVDPGTLKPYNWTPPPNRNNPNPDPIPCFKASVLPLADKSKSFTSIPVRARFILKDENENRVVQQVPAPALDDSKDEHPWWICMNMGIPDNSKCCGLDSSDLLKGEGHDAGAKVYEVDGNQVQEAPATIEEKSPLPSTLGWAVCVAPIFGFDTTSLYRAEPNAGPDLHPPVSSPKTIFARSWINDLWPTDSSAPDWVKDLAKDIQDPSQRGKECAFVCVEDFDDLGAHGGTTDDTLASKRFLQFPFQDKSGHAYSDFVCYGINDGPVPDMCHSDRQGGDPFVKPGRASIEDFVSHIGNKTMLSAGQLGNVICGPFETISLFESFRSSENNRADFHRVLDFFTTSDARYPDADSTARRSARIDNADDGPVDWSKFKKSQVFSAAHYGRVNLNMPFMVERTSDKGTRVRATASNDPFERDPNYFNADHVTYNIFPFVAAVNGANCASRPDNKKGIVKPEVAARIANAIAYTKHESVKNKRFPDPNAPNDPDRVCKRNMIRSLADLGMADAESNPRKNNLLEVLLQEEGFECDADREAFLANAANAFTTRGQSFLVVIRADAYSPMFGMGADVKEGTSLATTHALVELWRDPEPARYADGSFPTDKDGNEVVYHNWQIRSFRIF